MTAACKDKPGRLFFASYRELADPNHDLPHTEAVLICATCPKADRQECATQGIRIHDRHTVRVGLRLWRPDERALLINNYGGTTHD